MLTNLSQSDLIAIIIFALSTLITILFYKKVKETRFIFLEKIHKPFNNFSSEKIENLNILYKEEEINDFLVYLNGTIIMVGDHDVKQEEIYYPLTLKINHEKGRWKYLNVEKKTELLDLEFTFDNNYAKIKTDLIKKNDFITLEGFYNSKEINYSIIHRIFNVNKKVHKISEDNQFVYIGKIIISIFFIILFSTLLSKSSEINENESNNKKTIRTEQAKLSKSDSIYYSTFKYDELYYINSDTLKYDSIFEKNYNLNRSRNKIQDANRDSLIDEMFKNNSNSTEKQLAKLSNKIEHAFEDSLFYEDRYSISKKTDSLLVKLLRNKQLIEDKKYPINDTISVSFSLPEYYLDEEKTFEDFLIQLLPYLVILVFSVLLLYDTYNLYYLKKLSKIYK